LIKVPQPDGTPQALQSDILQSRVCSMAVTQQRLARGSISFILLWLFLMWLLYRKNLIVKI
jgi:hypothetical protein